MSDPAPNERVLTLSEHETRLQKGWDWLARYPNHRGWEGRFARWLEWVRAYLRHRETTS